MRAPGGCRRESGARLWAAVRGALLVVLLLGTGGLSLEAAPRRVSRSASLAEGQAVRLELESAWVQFAASPRSTLRIDLEARCIGELVACEPVLRQLELELDSGGDGLELRLAGPPGFAEHLRSARPPDDPQVAATYDPESNLWSRFWDWRRPEAGQWFIALKLKIDLPLGHPLTVELVRGDLEVQRLGAGADLEVGEGSLFVAAPRAEVGKVSLRAQRGRIDLVDATGRDLGKGRNGPFGSKASWQGPGKEMHLEARVGRGYLQVRVL